MLNIKKWLAMLLAVVLLFNFIPLNVLAEELAELPAEEPQVTESPVVTPEVTPDSEVSSDTEETPDTEETQDPSTGPGSELTPDPDQPGEPQDTETPSEGADDTQTPADSDAQPPADGGEDVPPAEGGEDVPPAEGEEALAAAIQAYSEFSDPFAKQFATALIAYGLANDTTPVTSIITETDSRVTLNVGTNAGILVLLSHQTQSKEANYCNWKINFNSTGSLDLGTASVSVPDSTDTLTYQGLGDDGFPFAGIFTGNIGGFTSSYTIFKSVSTAVELSINATGIPTIPITWSGTQEKPILAKSVVVATAEEQTLNFPATSSSTFSPYIGELTRDTGLSGDAGLVILPTLNYSSATSTYNGENNTAGNLGLVCNTMGDNTNLQIAELTLPAQIDLRGTANVGGLVGQLDSGATLSINQKLDLKAHLEGANAGGLVGQINGGFIQFETDAGVEITAELKATQSAGGIVGALTTKTGPLIPCTVSGTESTTNLTADSDTGSVDDNPTTENAEPAVTMPEADVAVDESVSLTPESSMESDNGEVNASLPLFSGLINLFFSLFTIPESAAREVKTPPENVRISSVKANGTENAGVLYGSCTVSGTTEPAGTFYPFKGVTFTSGAEKEVSGAGNCGGVFGTLELTGSGKCTISGTAGNPLPISSTLTPATNNTKYGGIAGALNGSERKHALVVSYCNVTSTVNVGTDSKNYPKYIGGLVAVQGATTTVDASNSTVTISNPKTPTNTYGIGGLCTEVGAGALLIADTMKVVIDSFVTNQGSSGVAASTGEGAVVYLKNSLDLSECLLETCAYSGQIVGKQDSSLIYAPNVAITRLFTTSGTTTYSGVELDDIGNYGELYRINSEDPDNLSKKPFLSIENNYAVTFNYQLEKGDTGYTLSTKEDYACLALAWQSRGNFSTVDGIGTDNWGDLKGCAITLGDNNINLTGCGIGGLTRDYDKDSTNDVFTGSFNGNGKKITLDIGAKNSENEVAKGDGRIYWHNATGLFAVLGSNATVNNLTLDGRIRLSNNRLTPMYSGALAALMNGSRSDDNSTLSQISTSVEYNAQVNGNTLYLGGLIGLLSGGSAKIDFDTGTSLASTITISHSGNGSTNHFGGAIGAIASGADATITCNGATIGGKIESTVSSGTLNNLYAGGLIGTILPGSNKSRTIYITNLTCSDFKLSGKASERMGGILGGIWADANVEINGLTVPGKDENDQPVTSATLNADGAAELGGLVYRASGKWTVNSADLSGLTIKAPNATALGLMVCHGEPYSEPINGEKAVGGLYLEMATHWGTGYQIPNVSADNFKGNVFDEFVAYTAYAYSGPDPSDPEKTKKFYDITHNGSGIISLKTDTGTVNMTSGDRNTYVNRTAVGQSKQTNLYSRYYYNLDSIMATFTVQAAELAAAQAKAEAAAQAAAEAEAAAVGTDDAALLSTAEEAAQAAETAAAEAAALAESAARIDTAGELLIWSVSRYADRTLRNHFTILGIDKLYEVSTIGGTSEKSATFDMNGLSYYPIDITNENVTVQYADVKFYNDAIEAKEFGSGTDTDPKKNKLTREKTQHYTMHCALFNNFTVENITASTDYTLTVNGVSFAGTVGVVNGGSGALLCGNVKGLYDGSNTSICKVVLGSYDTSGNPINPVTLNGISVKGADANGYSPVLINTLGGYTTLEANYVTTSDEQNSQRDPAGSSLIGNVGGADANKVTVSFAGTIKLPEQKSGEGQVFTKATLLNSLQYVDGSATYTFNYNKDDGKHDATHGKELTTSVEYKGKIGYYNDQETTAVTSKTGASDFSGYLPYVALSPATKDDVHTLEKNWHELAVNIHSYNILKGCGTYGHPYIVTAKEFREAASFVNTGKASSGWKIRMPKDTAGYHITGDDDDNGNDKVVIYKKGNAESIQNHLRSAYYKLVNDENGNFELSNFNGIGSSPDTAFMGVIYSDGITVTLSGGSSAFIKYSYGSVVRDVNFSLNQKPTLTWKDPGRTTSGTTPAQQAPGTFFGGVIGCVLGGDNIIDGVTVTAVQSTNFFIRLFGGASSDFNRTLSGTNAYLIPVGGYVGVIAGGGVIFRGNCSESVSLSTTYGDGSTCHIYKNPIIGRVLGGYAFYEGTNDVPNNSDKNYTINKIIPVAGETEKDLSWDGSALTVNTAQGLLLLSAIVSSGAGSVDSNAYKNGVARNAKYDHIGEATKPDDYDIAKAEGRISYLSNYVSVTGDDNNIGKICTSGTDGITINFAKDATFDMANDMANYGNGYRGLSARYVSNAAFKNDDKGNPTVDASAVVLRVKSFDGQGSTVTGISMDVKEYANDDFHMASMGGIFNIVWTKQNGGTENSTFAKDLTMGQCTVSLEYVDSKGEPQKQAVTATFADKDGLCAVTVGGFIGSISDDGAGVKTTDKLGNYLFNNIHVTGNSNEDRSTITGPTSAGGLIGASAMTSTYLEGCPGILLSNKAAARFGPNFLNCSFSNVNITGKLGAGGLIGVAYAYESAEVQFTSMGCSYSSGNRCFASCTVTEDEEDDLTVGENATIMATSKHGVAGGLFGIVGMCSGVNHPQVNTQTGLTIVNQASMRTVSLSNVGVKSSTTTEVIYRSDNSTVNGPDKSANNAAAGGIIGRISHVNQTYVYDVTLSDCTVLCDKASSAYAGGIVAYGYTNTTMVIRRCTVTSTSTGTSSITGTFAGGLVGYGWSSGGYQLHVSDCEVSKSTIKSYTTNKDVNVYSGGLVGKAGGLYYVTNVLIKNTTITSQNTSDSSKNYCGRLFGEMNDAVGKFYVRAAGISVVVDKDRTKITIPTRDGGNAADTTKYNGYIAYADYAGTTTAVENEKSPYVTVNPNFTLSGTNKTLYGDAVEIARTDEKNVIPIASRIWEDQKSGVADGSKLNRVSYQNISTITSKNLPEVSTFRAVQNCGPTDLPVLTIKGGDTAVIEDYLNVITNGGYTKAKSITKNATTDADKVLKLNVSVYAYENDEFVEKSKEDLTNAKAPASIYIDNGELKVLGSSYDNTRNRFSLVEATFKVTVDGTSRTYTVSIPVVVIRELQYNFMATFAYGAEFQADTFATLDKHILESTGNPFTGYLSYVYNRDEKGEFAPYEWQSYMDAGGSMLAVDKELQFYNGLPSGTQLILVDCQHGNRAYQYQVEEGGIDKVNLSAFTAVWDNNNNIHFRSSMADVLGVTKSDKTDSGKFVVTSAEDATVRLNGEYFRPYNADTDSGKDRYDLTVPTDLSTEENKPVENYYLVITVPDQGNQNYFLNGKLTSELAWDMPNGGTQVHRYNGSTAGVGNNDESTYQIYTGYQQKLESTADSGEAINLMDSKKTMQVALKDTISFSNQQAYDERDQLFVKFNVSLQEHTNKSTDVTEIQFPAGTSGTVHFYIQDSAGTYYYLDGQTWKTVSGEKAKDEAGNYLSYHWVSRGSNMELLLSADDGSTALDLAWVRENIKEIESLESKIIITAEMDIEFAGQEVLEATVPASANSGTDIWAQLHYVALLSTQASSLDYTANRKAVNDNAHYYRAVQYQAVLSMDATVIDQLGVNPLQLVEKYQATVMDKNASKIDLIAALDLSNLPDYESTLRNTKEIQFNLSLERRGNGYEKVENASEYLAFKWPKGSTDWNWTIQQDKFYADGGIQTSDLFDGAQFTVPLTAYVFTDQKDFANYKIVLSVSFLGTNGNTVSLDDSDNYVVYTYACIKPTFYDPSVS